MQRDRTGGAGEEVDVGRRRMQRRADVGQERQFGRDFTDVPVDARSKHAVSEHPIAPVDDTIGAAQPRGQGCTAPTRVEEQGANRGEWTRCVGRRHRASGRFCHLKPVTEREPLWLRHDAGYFGQSAVLRRDRDQLSDTESREGAN